jgi:hypothetical protein
VDDDGEQEEEEAAHQRKKKHPKQESDENNGREKETTVRWVEGQKRKENNWVVRRVAVWRVRHRQGWGAMEDQYE